MPFKDINEHDCMIPFHSTTSTTFSTTFDTSSMGTTIKPTEISTNANTDKIGNGTITSFGTAESKMTTFSDEADSSTTGSSDETTIQTKPSTEEEHIDIVSTLSISEKSTDMVSPEAVVQHQDITFILTGTIAGIFVILLVAIILIRR